jgi:hypothetical protein
MFWPEFAGVVLMRVVQFLHLLTHQNKTELHAEVLRVKPWGDSPRKIIIDGVMK